MPTGMTPAEWLIAINLTATIIEKAIYLLDLIKNPPDGVTPEQLANTKKRIDDALAKMNAIP